MMATGCAMGGRQGRVGKDERMDDFYGFCYKNSGLAKKSAAVLWLSIIIIQIRPQNWPKQSRDLFQQKYDEESTTFYNRVLRHIFSLWSLN